MFEDVEKRFFMLYDCEQCGNNKIQGEKPNSRHLLAIKTVMLKYMYTVQTVPNVPQLEGILDAQTATAR